MSFSCHRLLEKFQACERDSTYLEYLQQSSPLRLPDPLPLTNLAPTISWRSLTTPTSSATTTPTVGAAVTNRDPGKIDSYDRLTRSLLSGYPNEVDFVFNVLTIMTFKSPSSVPLMEVCNSAMHHWSHCYHLCSLVASPARLDASTRGHLP